MNTNSNTAISSVVHKTQHNSSTKPNYTHRTPQCTTNTHIHPAYVMRSSIDYLYITIPTVHPQFLKEWPLSFLYKNTSSFCSNPVTEYCYSFLTSRQSYHDSMKNLPSVIQEKLPNTLTKTLLWIVASRARKVLCKMTQSFVVNKNKILCLHILFPISDQSNKADIWCFISFYYRLSC